MHEKGVQSKDCQVATIGDNHTQTSPSVSSQVRTFDWSRKGEISSTLGSSLFVHADDTLNEEQEEEKSVENFFLFLFFYPVPKNFQLKVLL